MVRSVILVSIIAFYLSLSAVEAQGTEAVSNESISSLIKYINEHPEAGSENLKSAIAAVAESRKNKAEKASDQPNAAEKDNSGAEAATVTDAESPSKGEGVVEQDAPDEAAPADEATQAEEVSAVEGEVAENDTAATANDDPKEQDIVKELNNDKASPAKDDKAKKGDSKHEGALKSDVSVEALKESLRKIRQSIHESTKDSSSGARAAANLPLAQTNQGNALLANGPKDQGVILAGDASDHQQGESNMSNSTLPSDSTIPQIAEPTNVPITNYDMSVTAGMSLTNGGSAMSSASMSAPASSGTPSSTSTSAKPSSTSSSRPSATSTSAAHASGATTNYNNYTLMFIGFTIFMSNMITMGFLS